MRFDTNLSKSELVSLLIVATTAIFLVGLENKPIGWMLYSTGLLLHLAFTRGQFRRHMGLVYISFGLLGLIPITTEITNENFLRMGGVLSLALLLPFVVSRYIWKDDSIQFKWHHGRRWFKKEILYIVVTAGLAYLLLPYYLKSTGAYLNWGVEDSTESILRLFIGTNALGIWDELFFVSTILGLLRKYLPFWAANLLQAVLFTSFLYELGFTGWGPLVIYPFALTQGFIFRNTDSLFYVITIHLTLDFILFMALVNAHLPTYFDIFVVG